MWHWKWPRQLPSLYRTQRSGASAQEEVLIQHQPQPILFEQYKMIKNCLSEKLQYKFAREKSKHNLNILNITFYRIRNEIALLKC